MGHAKEEVPVKVVKTLKNRRQHLQPAAAFKILLVIATNRPVKTR